ncbi:MurR/RpiR family transcriptional regulator [bacterium]|nr:MAG: MurR/RpiR family transcriptional regulator [bacterium]
MAKRRAGPKSYADLAELLQRDFEGLTPSHQRVARLILTEPANCAFMTVSELADAAGVDASTVSRFAMQQGLGGFPALARLCQERLRADAQLLQRFDSLPYRTSPGSSLFTDVVANDQRNIAQTFAHAQASGDWAATVSTLAKARHVYVVGMRVCHSPAYLLAYLLSMLRAGVVFASAEAGRLPDLLRRLAPEDAVVVVSIHPYSRDAVATFRFAQRRGAVTISLTDNAASPLARGAAFVYCVETAGVSIMRSVTAFVSLAETLASAVALRLGKAARTELSAQEEMLREFGAYETHSEDAGTYFKLAVDE